MKLNKYKERKNLKVEVLSKWFRVNKIYVILKWLVYFLILLNCSKVW